MAGGRRGPYPPVKSTAVEENAPETKDDVVMVKDDDDSSSTETEIWHLRGRWELASVLNFLSVFEPVIGSGLKLTAEEIEAGLLNPNTSLAQLHIQLLKGIPPVSKTLNGSDAWVTALCKKLAIWWPWVAEGEIPLTAAKGEEILRYKELDPTYRLQILKALCEIRVDQDDAVSFINDALKSGTEISCFRKDNIGGDGNATCYWCDGGPVIGHRLYKEVKRTNKKTNMKAKASKNLPALSFEWQTLATNLEEFEKVVDELSLSKVEGEIAVSRTVETNFLPVVEKFHKKKERALKRKQRLERLLNDFRSYETGITRSCRHRRPISYTFDDYDRVIDEAIEVTKKKRRTLQSTKKHTEQGKFSMDGVLNMAKESLAENGDLVMGKDSKDENIEKVDSMDTETESDDIRHDDVDKDDEDDDYSNDNNDDYDSRSDKGDESGSIDEEKANPGNRNGYKKPFGSRWSMRLAGVMNHPVAETRDFASKNRLRQRPVCNSALLDSVVLDSDDENLSQNTNGQTTEHEDQGTIANFEEFSDH